MLLNMIINMLKDTQLYCKKIYFGLVLKVALNIQLPITCSKLTPDKVNFEHISHPVLVFLLLTMSRKFPAGYSFRD